MLLSDSGSIIDSMANELMRVPFEPLRSNGHLKHLKSFKISPAAGGSSV